MQRKDLAECNSKELEVVNSCKASLQLARTFIMQELQISKLLKRAASDSLSIGDKTSETRQK